MNTSSIFAKLPNDIKGIVVEHLTDNSENHKRLQEQLNDIFTKWDGEVGWCGEMFWLWDYIDNDRFWWLYGDPNWSLKRRKEHYLNN